MKWMIALLILVALIPSRVEGQGIQGQMEEQFGVMIHTTNPQAAMGVRRGVITGGSLRLRTRVVHTGPIQLVSAEEMSISSGDACGGIDLFGGSFSAISGDQLKDVLRQIASQAGSYAFQLALSSVCDKCMTVMNNVNNVLRELNISTKDSCTWAKGIVQSVPGVDRGTETERAEMLAAMTNLRSAFSSDIWDAMKQNTPGESATGALAENDPDALAHIVGGNILWEALKRSDVSSWLGGSTDATGFAEEVMSLTGSIRICSETDERCKGIAVEENPGVHTVPIEATLSFRDLINGSTSDAGAVPALVWDCDDDACLAPSLRPYSFEGMATMVRRVYLGDGSSTGIIYKYEQAMLDSPLSYTEEEEGMLVTNSAYSALVIRLLRQNNTPGARQFVEDFADSIAAEVTYSVIADIMDNAIRAVSVSDSPARQTLLEQIRHRRSELREEYLPYRRTLADASTTYALLRDLGDMPNAPVATQATMGGAQ
ncbi:MAG: conjugal transfer protein TraH [Xanthomonadales bacterium]|nr:conjugal transfer protein TraH [Xanthomonadales bacterium]